MPSSDPFGKEWAADIYAVVKPDRVIDIGPGEGTWAKAFRHRHKSWWIGVEIWEPYVEQYDLRAKYDRIVVADARGYIVGYSKALKRHDLVIAGDVLEHMEQSEAEALCNTVLDAGAHLLVSVPIVPMWQGTVNGNVHETHIWTSTHEWAIKHLDPCSWAKGELVGAYWSAP